MDLAGAGVETVKTARVDADGNISLPYVGEGEGGRLSSADLEQAVAKAYEDKKCAPERPRRRVPARPRRVAPAQQQGRAAAGSGRRVPAGAMPGMPGVSRAWPRWSCPAWRWRLRPRRPVRRRRAARPGHGRDARPQAPRGEVRRRAARRRRRLPPRRHRAPTSSSTGARSRPPASTATRRSPRSLRDVAFKDVLAVVLRSVDHSLQLTVQNGVIQIGAAKAAAEAGRSWSSAAYDVGDLVAAADDPKGGGPGDRQRDQPDRPPRLLRVAAAAAAGGGGRGLFDGGPGGQGTISAFGNKVVVTATPRCTRRSRPCSRSSASLLAKPATTKPAAKAERQTRAEDMSAEDIAEVDQQMANHLQMKQEIELKIEQMKQQGRGAKLAGPQAGERHAQDPQPADRGPGELVSGEVQGLHFSPRPRHGTPLQRHGDGGDQGGGGIGSAKWPTGSRSVRRFKSGETAGPGPHAFRFAAKALHFRIPWRSCRSTSTPSSTATPRLTDAQALELYHHASLHDLGEWASRRRRSGCTRRTTAPTSSTATSTTRTSARPSARSAPSAATTRTPTATRSSYETDRREDPRAGRDRRHADPHAGRHERPPADRVVRGPAAVHQDELPDRPHPRVQPAGVRGVRAVLRDGRARDHPPVPQGRASTRSPAAAGRSSPRACASASASASAAATTGSA